MRLSSAADRVAISAARRLSVIQIEFHSRGHHHRWPNAGIVKKIRDFMRVMRVAIGKHGGVGQPHHGDAKNLRQRPGHMEARIAEMLHVISRVVVGMIRSVAALKIILHR